MVVFGEDSPNELAMMRNVSIAWAFEGSAAKSHKRTQARAASKSRERTQD